MGAIQVENLSVRTPCQAMSRKDPLREKWGSDACAWNSGPQLTAHFLSRVPSLRFSGVPLAVFCSPRHWHIAVEACTESPTVQFLHPQSSIPDECDHSREDVCEAPSTKFCPQHTPEHVPIVHTQAYTHNTGPLHTLPAHTHGSLLQGTTAFSSSYFLST